MKPLGLYIHIPFCRRKCYYCDFVSYPDSEGFIDTYIESLISEARLYLEYLSEHEIDTIFIGGGTPSLLTPEQIKRLMSGLSDICAFKLTEATIETNPETLDDKKLAAYAECGLNRLSIGLQTHDDKILKAIGRRHTFCDFLRAYESARRYFNNINVDVIFGLPEQSPDNLLLTLSNIVELRPEHVSVYSLKLEHGTKLYDMFEGVDEDIDREMYHAAINRLENAGYIHYETSNFDLPGAQCLHNLKYWTGGEYLGLGVAAHSFTYQNIKLRHSNYEELKSYINAVNKNEKPISHSESIDFNEIKNEYIMLRLRLKQGISFADYCSRFSENFLEAYNDQIIWAISNGLIFKDENGIYPTIKGFDLQNALITEFIKKI